MLEGLPLHSNGRGAGAHLTGILTSERMPGTEDGPLPGLCVARCRVQRYSGSPLAWRQ